MVYGAPAEWGDSVIAASEVVLDDSVWVDDGGAETVRLRGIWLNR